jgi:GTP-binding protein EngB required for normal cell division
MSKKPNSGSAAALHKVIMVGSGGVGKSAVSFINKIFIAKSLFLMTLFIT